MKLYVVRRYEEILAIKEKRKEAKRIAEVFGGHVETYDTESFKVEDEYYFYVESQADSNEIAYSRALRDKDWDMNENEVYLWQSRIFVNRLFGGAIFKSVQVKAHSAKEAAEKAKILFERGPIHWEEESNEKANNDRI